MIKICWASQPTTNTASSVTAASPAGTVSRRSVPGLPACATCAVTWAPRGTRVLTVTRTLVDQTLCVNTSSSIRSATRKTSAGTAAPPSTRKTCYWRISSSVTVTRWKRARVPSIWMRHPTFRIHQYRSPSSVIRPPTRVHRYSSTFSAPASPPPLPQSPPLPPTTYFR